MKKPITGKPNATDDDTVNRGVTGQCLRDKSMNYDPATGKGSGGCQVNLPEGKCGTDCTEEKEMDYDD